MTLQLYLQNPSHFTGSYLCRTRPLFQTSRKQRRVANMQTSAAVMPPQYGYVMASVAVTAGVVQWMAIRVGRARGQFGVKYPAMMAEGDSEDALKFNCTQRSHQNTLEQLPTFLAMQLLLAQAYPLTAAALGMIWNVARIMYAVGYSTGIPKKRIPGGAISALVSLGMMGTLLVTGVRLAISV